MGATGRPAEFVADDGIPFSAELALIADDRWEVRHRGEVLHAYAFGDVRLSVLWKAFCFATDAEAAAYDDHTDDLTRDVVTEIFRGDLRQRGIAFADPGDPSTDVAWRDTLQEAYPAATGGGGRTPSTS